jgi:penicillin amidase
MHVAKPAPRLFLFLFLVTACIACGDDDDDGSDADTDGQATEPAPPLFEGRDPDETLRVEGIGARVEIARDEFGIPHIFAFSYQDGAFAQGYMQARDRFFQMDIFRHFAQGRLAEYFGQLVVDMDVDTRAFMMTTDGEPVNEAIVALMSDELRAVEEAYSAGVNTYIKELKAGQHPVPGGYNNDVLLSNFSLDIIPDWRPADTVAIGRLQQQMLSDDSAADMERGALFQALPEDIASDIIRYQPADLTAVLPEFYDSAFYQPEASGSSTNGPPADADGIHPSIKGLYQGLALKEILRDRIQLFEPQLFPGESRGSNNWVISGEHTESGNPLVLNDPHLMFMNPPLFYHAQMDTAYYGDAEGDEALGSIIGISFTGVPGVLIGHNQYVAWGATVVAWDVADVYVETLNETGDAVLFDGEWVDIVPYEVEIRVLNDSGFDTVTRTIEMVPHHGAIIRGSKADGKAMTARWTGQQASATEFDWLRDLLGAQNIDQWMDAMSGFTVGGQNWNGADIHGDTGYMPAAVIPLRKSVTGQCDPTRPVDGTGPCEWIGYLHRGQIPHTKNRPSGYVITANNDVTGTLADNDPTNDEQYLRSGAATGFRARRITDRVQELIDAGGKITIEQMKELQADNLSLEAGRLLPFVFEAAEALPDRVADLGRQSALARLTAWDLLTPSGVDADYRTDGGPDAAEIESSIAAAIFYTFLPRFHRNIFQDEAALYGSGSVGTSAALYLLENPDTSATGLSLFDDITTADVQETRHDIILQSLGEALDFLRTTLGSEEEQWRWGKLHQVEIQDVFGQVGISFDTLGPYPRGGASYTVDVASSGSSVDSFIYRHGPQMRFAAELGPDGIVSQNSLPGGQVDLDDSPHKADLLPGWLRNETFPYYFTPEDVVAHTEELIVLEPASEPAAGE